MKWKAFNPGSLSALLSKMLQIRNKADANAFALSGLGSDLQALANQTSSALSELDNAKAAKPVKGSFTIPTTGWGNDSTTGYTKYYDIAIPGVTVNDRADIVIAPGSVNAAAACGMCPVSETLAGKVRIRASKVPTAAISAEYWIEKE